MKANRKFVNDDEGVSPVIAVILMVAITVVLAATVYLWVSGFGSNQQQLVNASFAAKAVDIPNGDTDTSDDVIQLTYVSGSDDLATSDIAITIDGVLLAWSTTDRNYYNGTTFTVFDWCTSNPGADVDNLWERGTSVYLFKGDGGAFSLADECDLGTNFDEALLADLDGVHQLAVGVRGQVVLDTTIEVHDDAGA